MAAQAKGSFAIKSTPLPVPTHADALPIGRMLFHKEFDGDFKATSVVEMLALMNKELMSGAYVALERLTGTLHGKKGSFFLQHSSTMARGKPTQKITVVPDSGTDELKGLSGSLTIDIVDGKHFYTFDYDVGG